jgi:hypothetical protein
MGRVGEVPEGHEQLLVPRDTAGLEVTLCNETVGGRCIEMHGGYGAMLEVGVEKYTRTPPCTCTWTRPSTCQASRS